MRGAADPQEVERWCVKPGYRENPAPRSFDREQGALYWTEERLAAASFFQYPVYLLCRDLLRSRGARSFLDVGSGPGTKLAELIAPLCSDLVLVDQPSSREIVARELPSRVFHGADLDALDLDLGRGFDLIVCADVLEHLVDPWSVVRDLRRIAQAETRLAVSIPSIRFLPALARIAVGRGFAYEEMGIFDSTHLRFFTRRDADLMLRRGGWEPQRWGAPPFGRLGSVRRLAHRSTRGRSDEWLAAQMFVVARPVAG